VRNLTGTEGETEKQLGTRQGKAGRGRETSRFEHEKEVKRLKKKPEAGDKVMGMETVI